MRPLNSILKLCCVLGVAVICLPSLGCAQGPIESNSLTTQQPAASGQKGAVVSETTSEQADSGKKQMEKKMEVATFGGGCFWCVEAVFLELKGVSSVKSGYMGGHVDNPTYDQVCGGKTGHAEIVHIEFDPDVVSFDVLLQVFWKTHDPTTLNRQGNDVGTQYRSAVFYHNESQKEKATTYKKKLNELKAFRNPIVTEIAEASKLYIAENYHQNYFNRNPNQPYCRALIPPKIEKLRKAFGEHLKTN